MNLFIYQSLNLQLHTLLVVLNSINSFWQPYLFISIDPSLVAIQTLVVSIIPY